jgi:DNA-binding MarR family transcriptional regulator
MEKENLLDLINRLKAGCITNEMRIMKETGLSPAEYNGIAAVSPGETITCSVLSRKMALSPSRASRVIDKMVKNGYLVRQNDAADRRKCTVSLAKRGIHIKKKIDQLKADCDKRIREQLSQKEIETLTHGLEQIIEVI